jgi:periodic tryptophan protein 1
LYVLKCRGTDNLILAGHVEGDAAMLEVYVYNDVEDALYVHHDILLPSLPLALGRIFMIEKGLGSLLS